MDPLLWGFVRGGSATLAVGGWPLAYYAVYAGHPWVGAVWALVAMASAVVFALNEARRP